MNEPNYLYQSLLKMLSAKVELDRAAAFQESGATLLSQELHRLIVKTEKFHNYLEEKRMASVGK